MVHILLCRLSGGVGPTAPLPVSAGRVWATGHIFAKISSGTLFTRSAQSALLPSLPRLLLPARGECPMGSTILMSGMWPVFAQDWSLCGRRQGW